MRKPFLPYTGKRMTEIRSTPKTMEERDAALFPRLDLSFRERKFPLYYYVRKGPKFTTVTVDYFFVPHEIRRNLQRLYHQYVSWLISRPGKKEKVYYLSNFQDYASVEVLTEHALWWVELFERAASLLVDSYHLTAADVAEDQREERERQQARVEARLITQECKRIGRHLGGGKPQATKDEREEARRLLLAWALDHQEEWHTMTIGQRAQKAIAFRFQVATAHAPTVSFDGEAIPLLVTPPKMDLKRIAREFFQRTNPPPVHSQTPPPLRPPVPGAHQEIIQYIQAQSDQAFRNTHNVPTYTHPKGVKSMVKLFKNGDDLGIQTDAQTEDEFTTAFAVLLAGLVAEGTISAIPHGGGWEFHLTHWLPCFVDICCKLRGYKADVVERRLLTAGFAAPAAEITVGQIDARGQVQIVAGNGSVV